MGWGGVGWGEVRWGGVGLGGLGWVGWGGWVGGCLFMRPCFPKEGAGSATCSPPEFPADLPAEAQPDISVRHRAKSWTKAHTTGARIEVLVTKKSYRIKAMGNGEPLPTQVNISWKNTTARLVLGILPRQS